MRESLTVTRVSGLLFLVIVSALTLLRVGNAEPPVSVQSAIVNAAAVLTLLALARYVARGGSFIDCWLLALGPCFAYTLNLLVPLIPIFNVVNVVSVGLLALAAGLAVSGVLTTVAYAVGQLFRTADI
ncbi:hypothetical protein [Halonotius roseus]|uniref:Uncharacterized protein n=1 Tax=Halonotius roseus TaxID=2511997 RepID=A0A544QN16_9EURY|nr:hypothetical protein [Halonotius roseus]TQQ80308.1 hypothetical protein EWF95_07365 [Halonotius roseus]